VSNLVFDFIQLSLAIIKIGLPTNGSKVLPSFLSWQWSADRQKSGFEGIAESFRML
jgi:hypothetical protein